MRTFKTITFFLLLLFSNLIISQIRTTTKADQNALDAVSGRGGIDWVNNYPKTCFCCDGVFNLPTAVAINGPQTIDCAKPTVFTIDNCKGTTINWSVSPSVSFTGQGTNSITLNAPFSGSSYTISVTLRCGEKSVTGTRNVKLNVPSNVTPAFLTTLTQVNPNSWNINTVPTMLSGVDHWWGIQYNGVYPNCSNQCLPIPYTPDSSGAYNLGIFGGMVSSSGIFTPIGQGTNKTSGTSGYGINYNFPNNSCFKITHYVRVCGVTYRQTQCVKVETNNLKVANGTTIKPNITVGEIEIVN